MKKLLNPKSFYSKQELLNLPIREINGKKFRVLVKDERYIVTSCQCFKDCNCQGSISGELVTYYRSLQYDNTDKAFYSDPNYVPKWMTNLKTK